jgi:rhamnosyl/mannosyltransferase
MRVLHLGKYYPPVTGGVETVTHQLAEGMTRLGVPSDVLCFNPNGVTAEEAWMCQGGGRPQDALAQGSRDYTVFRAAAPVVVASTPLSPAFARLLTKLAPAYDILHVHCPNPMATLALRLANPRAKVVLHWHSDVIRQKYFNKYYRLLLGDWLAARTDAVIGATPAHVEDSEYAPAFRGKARVIPFCLDPEPFAPERVDQVALARLRERFARKKAVFSLGRLISYKGFDVLMEAARMLPEGWVVLIGGTGPLEGELRRQIVSLKLTDKVVPLGKVPQEELSACYHFCRVFCLPSVTRAEMYGMVQLEAMACGRPVVSTRIPGSGVPWVNEHGVTGLTVPPSDPAALAEAILAIDRDQARWEAMAASGLLASRERFAPGVMLSAVGELYEELLADG